MDADALIVQEEMVLLVVGAKHTIGSDKTDAVRTRVLTQILHGPRLSHSLRRSLHLVDDHCRVSYLLHGRTQRMKAVICGTSASVHSKQTDLQQTISSKLVYTHCNDVL